MVRVIKDPEERKNDILTAAMELFKEKGYGKTAVSDIVKAAGIAQGTFYIYYKNKEDVFISVIENTREKIIQQLIDVQKRNDLNAVEKMNLIIKHEFDINRTKDDLILQLHLEKNSGIHLQFIINTIHKLVPIYTSVIEQGVKEGLFDIKYPKEAAEYMLVATKFLFDPGIFSTNLEELQIKAKAVEDISERILGSSKNSLKSPNIMHLLKGEI
ncbi:TetR/AcrR family transcriptional regulator [Clostridium diolis]|uniref:AcrR family transcriptional regulator n=1 Tax=Clostridium diolis TaxID=223919 RepID=A0AAV3W1D7_9CLOT|nr:TetR/AcrR family transcriptional regulator [Clostridium diolis]QES73984.1 TetR/AcrR family transcriptional regulator [Clostridium diolis]GEA31317.1 AcrR family transcriptional regulator [Clostridium diolis]